jgi:CRISPR-associated protein Csm3
MKVTGNFFTGGGNGNGYIDSYLLKDAEGKPYIPGSLIKGKLRYYSEMIANTENNDELACKLSVNHNQNYKEDNPECRCSVCIIYGWQGNKKGFLTFYDAKINSNSLYENVVKTRTGTKVDRYLKTVVKGALYTVETTVDNLVFEGTISGYLPEKTYKKDIFLLGASFNMIDSIGGNQSRGFGFVGDKSFEVYLNGTPEINNIYDWKEGVNDCFIK